MTNISEEIINSTLKTPTLFSFADCLKELHSGFIFMYCVTTFCFLLGTPANLWCLWFYFCIERKVKQTHVFLLNDIIIELIFCLECAGEIINVFVFKNNKCYNVIYFFLCLSWSGRPLMKTCICIEQYLAVLHPVKFLTYKGIKYRTAAAVAVWLMSIGYTLYQLITMTFPDPVTNSLVIITVTVISFCCGSVLRALKDPGPGDTHNRNQLGRAIGNQQKRNAFNTILSALLLILFSYIPYVLITICTFEIDQILFECDILPVISSFNIFSVMVTPLLKIYREAHLKCLVSK